MNFALGAFLLSLISFFVSAGAVIVSIRQHRATKVHNRISVRPYINMVHEKTSEHSKLENSWIGVIKVIVINNGTGPALVESFDLYVDQKKVETTEKEKWGTAMTMLLGLTSDKEPPKFMGYGLFELTKGYCIPAGASITLFTLRHSMHMKEEIHTALERSRAVLVYKSFYGDDWTYDTDKVKRGQIEPFK
jgi:hypothetical protein